MCIRDRYSNTQVFFPISCKPPNGITFRVGLLLLLDPDELSKDLLIVEFDLDCIVKKFIKYCL